MLNNGDALDPVTLYRAATDSAVAVVDAVDPISSVLQRPASTGPSSS